MTVVLGLISTSIAVFDAHNETIEDKDRARLVNDTIKVQIKCFESMRNGHCLLEAFILKAKSK